MLQELTRPGPNQLERFLNPPTLATSECPVCHRSDLVEKASGIARRQRGTIHLDGVDEEVTFTTELGRCLACPQPPRPATTPGWLFGSLLGTWVVSAIVLAAGLLLTTQNAIALPELPIVAGAAAGFAWFGVLLPATFVQRFTGERLQTRRAMPKYRVARASWERVHYCSRDDVVFLPDEPRAFPPERLRVLLRQGG